MTKTHRRRRCSVALPETKKAQSQQEHDHRTDEPDDIVHNVSLSEADAKTRVDTVLANVDAAKNKAKAAADTARKASATFALLGALSLVIGAFIASVAAALGGKQRDEEEALFVRNDVQRSPSR